SSPIPTKTYSNGMAWSEASRPGIATTPCERRSPHPPCRFTRRSPAGLAPSGCKNTLVFEYGNRDIGGGIDQFWLTGNLRIDPVEQIDFVDRLRRGALLVPKRSQASFRHILPVTKPADTIIRRQSSTMAAESGNPSLARNVGP